MPTLLYSLIDQRPDHPNSGKPFYIGIGTKSRPHYHLREARSLAGHYNSRVQEVFAAHFALGIEPTAEIVKSYESRDEAIVAEIEHIAFYGRIGIEPGGILCNLAAGGDGPDPSILAVPAVKERLIASLRANWADPDLRERRLATLTKTNAALTTDHRVAASKKVSQEARQKSTEALLATFNDQDIMARRAENSREPQRQSWLDPVIRATRIDAMTGVPKTMTPEAIAARQANARAPRSQEALDAQLAAVIRNWADDAFRDRMSDAHIAAWQDPQKRANMLEGRSEGIAQSWQDEEVREKRTTNISAAVADKWEQDPDYAARTRAGLRAAWADPEKKAARVAKMLASRAEKGANRTAKGAARQSAVMTAVNASMSAEDRSIIQAKSWADPAVAAARKAGIQKAAQDPALKAARLAAMAAGKRRKAAERAARSAGSG
jgi:hypothetical protein